MKTTYWMKLIFLICSWLLLFDGLKGDIINEKIFFSSVLIYTGAIIFDLIFFCIETNAKVGKLMTGIYYGSFILAIVNFLLWVIELIGALGGLAIVQSIDKKFVVKIAQGGFTKVFPSLCSWQVKISIVMVCVLAFGGLSIGLGLLMTRLQKKNQEQS